MPDPAEPAAQRTGRPLLRRVLRLLAPFGFGVAGTAALVGILYLLLPVRWPPLPTRLLELMHRTAVPGGAMLFVGCCGMPVLLLVLVAALAVRCLQYAPRPWTVPVFVGCHAAMFCGDEELAVRALLAVGIASTLGVGEVLWRGLRVHRLTALYMLGIWGAEVVFWWVAPAVAAV